MNNSNKGESKMQNDISKEAPLVLDENTVIKGVLHVKPIDGSVVAFREGKLILRDGSLVSF